MKRFYCNVRLNFSDFEAEVNVGYWYTPPSEGCRYYKDGSGSPDVGAEIDIDEIDIHHLITRSGLVIPSGWLQDRGWYPVALDLVWDYFLNVFDMGSSVWYDLAEAATSDE